MAVFAASNGNGKPDFRLDLATAFMVVEHISASSENERTNERKEDENERINERKEAVLKSAKARAILAAIKQNPSAKYSQLIDSLRISQTTLWRLLRQMKEAGIIERSNGRKKGEWIVKE